MKRRRNARSHVLKTRGGVVARPRSGRFRAAEEASVAQGDSARRQHERVERLHEAAAQRHEEAADLQDLHARHEREQAERDRLALVPPAGGGTQLGDVLLTALAQLDRPLAQRRGLGLQDVQVLPVAPGRLARGLQRCLQLGEPVGGRGGGVSSGGRLHLFRRGHQSPPLTDDLGHGDLRHGHRLTGQQPRAVVPGTS